MSQHAKDYLVEYSQESPTWLKELIYQAINTNGNIEAEVVNFIYEMLFNAAKKDTEHDDPTPVDHSVKIQLKHLLHSSGVNALKNGQTIKFGENCTVLYGLNGSGKSGYFRVLNEIAGGNEQKDIFSNIHVADPEEISIKIGYSQDGVTTEEIQWENATRAVNPLSCIRVFDTSYLMGLLSKREVDATLVQPFGLHLFSYIISIIDGYKNRLKEDAGSIRGLKPNINTNHMSLGLIDVFESHSIADAQVAAIFGLFEFSDDKKKELISLEEKIKALGQNNIQDKIRLVAAAKEEIAEYENEINSAVTIINGLISAVTDAIIKYQEYSKQSREFKEQISILNAIPANNTEEWKTFIRHGEHYAKKVEDSETTCVYCRQPLQDEAIKIVQAYTLFLNNDSERKLSEVKTHLEAYKKKMEHMDAFRRLGKESKSILRSYKLEDGKSLCRASVKLLSRISALKNTIQKAISETNIEEQFSIVKVDSLLDGYKEVVKSLEEQQEELSKGEEEKNKQIVQLEEKLKPLLENKAVSEQQATIHQWMLLHSEEQRLLEEHSNLNTGTITRLSTRAHGELLTGILQEKFMEELAYLGLNNYEVKLVGAGGSRGGVSTKLLIKNRDDITLILSEGEQKAVALSMFVAEARMQNEPNPIVLDDPVNSLDHKIASQFANRLLKLDNQTVVFTHNRLFLDAFETSKLGHVCKNFDGGCNKDKKHIYLYSVQSEGKNSKGIILQKKEDRAATHVASARTYISETPFVKQTETASKLRKAVECLIDEKVFNSMVPTKYTSKNNRIHWDGLKQLDTSDELIEALKSVHDRVSGGELHNGTEAGENPIERDEFEAMVVKLEEIIE